MFLAKYLDQKQGEARVVDRQSNVRDRLEKHLRTRPSAAELVERGILGRAERLALVRSILDQFLRNRLQAREAELARIPPGDFVYSDRLRELLGGVGGAEVPSSASAADELLGDVAASAEEALARVRAEREAVERRLEESSAVWARCAEDCRRAACGTALLDAARGVGRALASLEAYRETAGESLKGVFQELEEFQRLIARRQCLERIVGVAERTESVREAVFACRAAEKLPLDMLEEVPELCQELPSRSRALGTRRLRFVARPLRTMLAQELHDALRATGVWPSAPSASAAPGAAPGARGAKVVRLCADLQRVQRVEGKLAIIDAAGTPTPDIGELADDEGSLWSGQVLAAPLVERFRDLFCRRDSDLCRMDKPDWAFKYLLEHALAEHGHLLESWLGAGRGSEEGAGPGQLSASQSAALGEVDLFSGLAVALACEARLFVRQRMPTLAQPEERPTLLVTLQHFVRFHADIVAAGGAAAGAAAFADFDANRPLTVLEKPKKKVSPEAKAAGAAAGALARGGPAQDSGRAAVRPATGVRRSSPEGRAGVESPSASPAGAAGAGGARSVLMGGLAHLKRGDGEAASDDARAPAGGSVPANAGGGGFGLGGARRLFGGLSQLGAVVAGGAEPENPLLAGISHLHKPGAGHPPPEAQPQQEREHVGSRIMAGLSSGLAVAASTAASIEAVAAAAAAAADEAESEVEEVVGFLDVWIAADAAFISERLASLSAAPSGAAWRPRALHFGAGPAAATSAPLGFEEDGIDDGEGAVNDELQAFELSNLFSEIFTVSAARADCLSKPSARKAYAKRVLDVGLQQAMSAVKSRWNAMQDLLAEGAREGSRLAETMADMNVFLDTYPLAEHFVASVDEANTLHINMLGRFAQSLSGIVQKGLRRVDSESCIFSFELGPPVLSLSRRLRPSAFRSIAQQVVAAAASNVLQHLRQAYFQSHAQLELFVGNCGQDLLAALSPATAVLEETELAPLRPLRDSCSLLALPRAEAERLLDELRRVVACSPVGPTELVQDPNSVLRRREAEALGSAGVEELSPEQAILVLSRRADLAGAMPQELLPASITQGAVQMMGALPQLGELGVHVTLQTGTLGVSQLRGLAGTALGGAGALGGTAAGLAGGLAGSALGVAGRLRSTMKVRR